MRSRRSRSWTGLTVALFLAWSGGARSVLADCGWYYDFVDSDNCTWDGSTLTCHGSWEYGCGGGSGAWQAPGGEGGSGGGGGGGGQTVELAPLTSTQQNNVSRGTQRARVKVENFSECASLFASLGTGYPGTPTGVIDGTTYRNGIGTPICDPRPDGSIPIAWSEGPGSNLVVLCGPMNIYQTTNEAALTLIHEATHFAGYLHEPGQMDSDALDDHIRDRCRLD